MTDYRNSRHKARWIFQPSALVKKREAANARAVNRLQQYGASNFEITSNTMPLWQPEEEILFSNDGENPRQPLTVNEEALVRRSYEFRIQQTCADLNFPHVVQATVIIFFKRFYLEWSVMDFPLDCIMLACVFLGTKVEEHEFSFEDLTAHLKQKAKVVNEYEMLILQSLEFDIAVYTPYLPCDGFGFDMEDFFVPVDGTCMSLKGLRDAKQYIDRLMLTDVPLIYNPGLIALAALYKVNEQHKLADFDRYLEHVCNIRCDLSVENLEGACRQSSLIWRVMNRKQKEIPLRILNKDLRACRVLVYRIHYLRKVMQMQAFHFLVIQISILFIRFPRQGNLNGKRSLLMKCLMLRKCMLGSQVLRGIFHQFCAIMVTTIWKFWPCQDLGNAALWPRTVFKGI